MTPMEYVEVLAVEQALYTARAVVRALEVRKNEDGMNWKRYTWALADQLGFRGLDGVR